MKRLLLMVSIGLVLSACGDKSAENATPVYANPFEHYTPVGTSADTAKLFVDLNSISRQDNLVRIKLGRLVDNGYVIQEALTNCTDSIQNLEGTLYHMDGSVFRAYPGDAQPLPYRDNPEIATVVKATCDKAGVSGKAAAQPKVNANGESPLPNPSPTKLQTRQGNLEVTRSNFDAPPDTLMLNGKSIYKAQGSALFLYKLFTLGTNDIVLMGSSCAGAGCSTHEFSFLIIPPRDAPKLVHNNELYGYENAVTYKQSGNKIILNLGFSNGKRKLATYQNGEISIDWQTVAAKPLDATHCEWLHTEAMQACIDANKDDANCDDPESNFSDLIARGTNAMVDYPGYNATGFTEQCKQACQTGRIASYSNFKSAICGYPKTASASIVDASDPNTVNPPPATPKPTTSNKPGNNAAMPWQDMSATQTATPSSKPAKPDTNASLPWQDVPIDTKPTAAASQPKVVQGCEVNAQAADQLLACMTQNLQKEKDRLNQTYKVLSDSWPADKVAQLEATQKTWLDKRNATCGKLNNQMDTKTAMKVTACIYQFVNERADELTKLSVRAHTKPSVSYNVDKQPNTPPTTGSISAAPAKPAPVSNDALKKGKSYAQAREQLLAAGWQPYHAPDADECLDGDTRCENRPEMEACAGTGEGNCSFLWQRSGRLMAIFTIGEDDPSVSGWEERKLPAKPATSAPPATDAKPAETPTAANDSANSTDEELWYQVNSNPTLTVRAAPDVTSAKLGTLPHLSKVQVLATDVKADLISGHNGHWVKIDYNGQAAYVFDGFLQKLN